MGCFTPSEIDEIDRLWRELPADHMWTGWAASGREPDQVWILKKVELIPGLEALTEDP